MRLISLFKFLLSLPSCFWIMNYLFFIVDSIFFVLVKLLK
jgi:hypothetical protein